MDDAARARRARPAPALPRLDLHAERVPLPLRLPLLRRDDGQRDRGLRGRLGLLRRRVSRPHPGQHQGDHPRRRSAAAAHRPRLPRVRAGARLRRRSRARAPAARQSARRAAGPLRARGLLRRRAARHDRARPHPRRRLVPRGGGSAPPCTHPASAPGALRSRRAAPAAPRAAGAVRRPALGRAEDRPRSACPGRQGALLAADQVCRPPSPRARRSHDGTGGAKVHPRQPPGGRSTDAAYFPAYKTAYALRDVTALERAATQHGPAIGAYARALLAGPLPWTRMRRVYALLGLVKRYGAARVEAMCQLALAAELVDVTRLKRMLALAT